MKHFRSYTYISTQQLKEKVGGKDEKGTGKEGAD